MLKSRICACVLFLYAVCASGQELACVRDSAILRLARQAELWPLEKVYVTTDRASYMPGDRIWLRAHLADADNRPSRISRYVYVELVSPGGELMRRIMLRPDTLGVFAGHIDLQEVLVGLCLDRNQVWRCFGRPLETAEYFAFCTHLVFAFLYGKSACFGPDSA